MSKDCSFWMNFDWITKDISIEWVFGYKDSFDGTYQMGGPWWKCINCKEIFYSVTMCTCDDCNPFSGYCRKC